MDASPNVRFYECQKELQDQVTKSEQERMHLDRQLRLLLQSDQNSSHLKATKLHAYWNKVCADEKRAQQRNAMLVREFERIDTHMSAMTARTERLDFLKRQYADYISRTYPNWTRKVEQKIRGTSQREERDSPRDTSNVRQSGDWAQAEKEDSATLMKQRLDQGDHHQTQQQHQTQQHHQTQQQHQTQEQDPSNHPQSPSSRFHKEASQQPSANIGGKDSEDKTAKLEAGQAMTKSDLVSNVSASSASKQKFGVMSDHRLQEASAVNPSSGRSGGGESSRSEYVNINQFAADKTVVTTHTGQGDQPTVGVEKDDFDSDSNLPLSAGDASSAKGAGDQGCGEDLSHSHPNITRSQHSTGSLLPELSVEGLMRLLHLIERDLRDLTCSQQYYRGSPLIDSAEKIDLIQRANTGGDLLQLSGSKASNLVLEQLSHVVSGLPEGCLIPDHFLRQQQAGISATTIGEKLSSESQKLWLAVFSHFNTLVREGAMEAKEIAAVFVPCLVAQRTQHQNQAFALLVNLLEGEDDTDASSVMSPRKLDSARNLGNSNSMTEDGKVPPLKFGSLLDKPLSEDEEYSFFDQSVPREPSVPLNETLAYKQMLSGAFSHTPQKAPVTSDDTDDDVEKQFANVLSPRTATSKTTTPAVVPQTKPASEAESVSESSSPGQKSVVYVPTAVEQRTGFGSTWSSQTQRRTGVLRRGSDFDTDSEMEPTLFGSSLKPMDEEEKDDFEFYG